MVSPANQTGQAADENELILAAMAQRYSGALSRYFQRRVRHKSDVPDLVQDVFVRLAKLSDLSVIESPDKYIFATAASALRDRDRRRAAHGGYMADELDENAHESSEISAERVLIGREAVARLHEALRQLPERTRDVFVLRVFEEHKLKDVARKLGISQRAVEKQYAKAVAHVSTALQDFRNV